MRFLPLSNRAHGADDPTILEGAAREERALVTYDVSTLSKHAYERVAAGQSMRGVFEVSPSVSAARATGF